MSKGRSGKMGSGTGIRIDWQRGEITMTDPKTGGQKGSKLARFDLIPPDALWELAEVYGRGAEKYDDRNWEKGYKWSLNVAALQRHLHQWLMGEDVDPDTECMHMAQVAWHAFALLTFSMRGLGTNDVRFGVLIDDEDSAEDD